MYVWHKIFTEKDINIDEFDNFYEFVKILPCFQWLFAFTRLIQFVEILLVKFFLTPNLSIFSTIKILCYTMHPCIATYGTPQFKLDTRVYHTRVFAIDFAYNSRVARERNHMRAHENNPIYSRANLVNANLITSINKSLETSLDTHLTCKLFAMHTHLCLTLLKGQFQHGEAKYGV